MYIKIHSPKEHSSNKGSSKDLVEYLEKENIGKDSIAQEYFFSHHQEVVSPYKVQDILDHNNKGLKSKDAKFYMLTINPSEKELAHIQNDPSKLKDYTRSVMDQYATDMNRVVNGRQITGSDLVYFAKLEKSRIYKPENTKYSAQFRTNQNIRREINAIKAESETMKLSDSLQKRIDKHEKTYVRNAEGTVILPGNCREGLNSHVHIIVSRQDMSQSTSMSPLANSRGSKNKLNGKEVSIGFHREKFVDKVETIFDKKFGYNRAIEESFQYRHGKIHDAEKFVKSLMNTSLDANNIAKRLVSQAIKDPVTSKLLYAPTTPQSMKNRLRKEAIKAVAAAVKLNPAGLPVQLFEKTLGMVGRGIGHSTGIGM
tara:strand:+ start:780 stop:1889 length:1110 start_codon:yes stop_codon:yes gene_type:complete